ncbi:hypothetical protein NFX46_01920 [Streptomyces phaeoluteigriseus]|uniref:Uncharacterized protein n=1 Tax=Streptomyces phaeoluteigriseus TaxID=114686 RepID=A0ABY4Z2R9_9ACTN|nr:hypothetical protein [Streptomyces phaeoluteigriseus]USQ82632.1 hypothetical protein NFX46_01920 [Streptomyces phaeoluteigriseus]
MKIRMLVEMPEGASRNGEPWPGEGEEADLPTAEAAHLVAAGIAEEVTAETEPPAAPRRRRAANSEGEAP